MLKNGPTGTRRADPDKTQLGGSAVSVVWSIYLPQVGFGVAKERAAVQFLEGEASFINWGLA